MLTELRDGTAIQTLTYLKTKRLISYKNKPGSFLSLTLTDGSGSIEAKLFDNAEVCSQKLQEGSIVSISGRGSVYQGSLGLILDAVELWDGPVDKADFMPAYPGDVAALEQRIDELIDSLRDPDLSRLVSSLLHDPEIRTKFREAPAAKSMHGAYLHGLLEHVVRQAEMAECVCQCYPKANRDLVISGILLHDIGKIIEFSWDMGIEYTKYGNLQGHIVIGDRLVFDRGRELGISEEIALRLSHLILSHHGEREYGAAVLPQTLESIILHSLDNLEAKATHCIEMIENSGDRSAAFTEYDRIEGHYWYRGDVVNMEK